MRTRPKAVCVLGAALLSMALAAGGSVGARPSQALLLRLGPIRNFQQASNWSGYAQTSSTYA
ncbi:MAG TPA: hypothetical protein VGP46_06070, partial [Acidimicrobiales bacterium]|nr:hypothetical protein [Acidimicrobiales bacterium]